MGARSSYALAAGVVAVIYVALSFTERSRGRVANGVKASILLLVLVDPARATCQQQQRDNGNP